MGPTLFLRFRLVPAIVGAALAYAVSLVGIFVVALIIDALAPSFGAEKNRMEAMKLVIYSSTAAWAAGVLYIIPSVGTLVAALGGLYSLYLMYLGIPKLMKCPPHKRVGYCVASLVVAVIVYAVVLAVAITGEAVASVARWVIEP